MSLWDVRAILREVIAAADLLKSEWGVRSEIWSVTSFSELSSDAYVVDRWNWLHPREAPRRRYITKCLAGDRPIIAATDYVRAYPQLISGFFSAPILSSERTRFFEVDRYAVAFAALRALVSCGVLGRDKAEQAGVAGSRGETADP